MRSSENEAKGNQMNKIKFEFFKNNADVASAEYDSTDRVLFIFPEAISGYLSLGPRILRVEAGEADIDLGCLPDGVFSCYLCFGEKRIELPSLEKLGRLFGMSHSSPGSELARVTYLKEQEARMDSLEERLILAEKKIFGGKGIL